MIKLSDIMIIATGPNGFPGASQIMSQMLREFSLRNCSTIYVGTKKPFLFNFLDDHKVFFKIIKNIFSEAIGSGKAVSSDDVLLTHVLTEDIVELTINNFGKYKRIIIWGTYLFPYGCAALQAKQILNSLGFPVLLRITPSGSDIWEIGPQLSHVAKHVLGNDQISQIITYTEQFSEEIKKKYELTRKITSIFPIIDFSRFYPISKTQKDVARKNLNIPNTSFVITSHSNMRPVKSPEDVIHIARSVAQRINKEVVLLMIGPKLSSASIYSNNINNLKVVNTGVVENVEEFLKISDVEVNCSWHDSFNLSLAEAMLCGVPCVSTDVVGIKTEIIKSKGGFLFEYEPPNRLENKKDYTRYESAIQCIVTLAKNEKLRVNMGNNAYKHAVKTFSPDIIMQKYVELINKKLS